VGADKVEHGNIHPAPVQEEGFITHTFDLDQLALERVG
jgi:hypothetical protein